MRHEAEHRGREVTPAELEQILLEKADLRTTALQKVATDQEALAAFTEALNSTDRNAKQNVFFSSAGSQTTYMVKPVVEPDGSVKYLLGTNPGTGNQSYSVKPPGLGPIGASGGGGSGSPGGGQLSISLLTYDGENFGGLLPDVIAPLVKGLSLGAVVTALVQALIGTKFGLLALVGLGFTLAK
jgi:hypothetical protein